MFGIWEARAADALACAAEGTPTALSYGSPEELRVLEKVFESARGVATLKRRAGQWLDVLPEQRADVSSVYVDIKARKEPVLDVVFFGLRDAAYQKLERTPPGSECSFGMPACKALAGEWQEFLNDLQRKDVWFAGRRGKNTQF